MLTSPAPWEQRFHRFVVAGHWVALIVGVVSSMVQSRGAGMSLVGLAAASLYVIAVTMAPTTWWRARFGSDGLALGGVILVLLAMTVTGGGSSPYLLLSTGPTVWATMYGGFRSGIYVGTLAGFLLVLVTLSQGGLLIEGAPALGLYLVFVLLIGAIRRLLDDIHRQAQDLAAENVTTTNMLQRLEAMHQSLVTLAEDPPSGRLNAIEVGANALDSVLKLAPGSSGRLAVTGEEGPVVLVARGIPPEDGITHKIDLTVSDARVGYLELTSPGNLSDAALQAIETELSPAGMAFANLRLVQQVVGSAVAEERTRLSRELHDEIGPALASLGLALDIAAMNQAEQPELEADLRVLRTNVTKLVEDVRASIADLRIAPGPTLTARILESTSKLDGSPPIVVDINERRPPRSALIGELASIVAESARNAHKHSGASKVVISGSVDRDFGKCTIVDDGVGFNPDLRPEGHFGLVGMQERADRIGAQLKVESKDRVGTAVTVEWGTT